MKSLDGSPMSAVGCRVEADSLTKTLVWRLS
jgi:hypothetical protein